MPDAFWLAFGVILPCLLAGAVLLALGRWWRGATRGRVGVAWMAAVGAGYVAGHLAVEGRPNFGAMESSGWLAFVYLPAAVAVMSLPLLRGVPKWVVVTLEMVLAFGLAPLLLPRSSYQEWTGGELAGAVAGLGLVVTLTAWGVNGLTRRSAGPWLPFSMAGLVLFAGVILFCESDSFSCGQRGISLAAAVLGAAAASVWLTVRVGQAGGMTLAAFTLAGLTVEAVFSAEMGKEYAVAIALAPWAGWVVELPVFRRMKPWQRGLIRAGAMILPLAVVSVLAAGDFLRRMQAE